MNELFTNICAFLGQHFVRTILLLIPLLLLILYRSIILILKASTRKRHESSVIDKDLAVYIDAYLKMKAPGFSVFINGAWGSGKTFFIKQYIQTTKSNAKSCYVSLFGISSKEEFEFALWKGILFSDYDTLGLLLWSLLSITISVGFILYDFEALTNIEFWSFFAPISASVFFGVWCFAKLKLRDRMLANRYLVFDDFERTEVDYPKLMAWVSELVEHSCCPVIIIGNEREIIKKLNSQEGGPETNSNNTEERPSGPDSFACAQYKRMKEKVIGREFLLNQNDNQVVSALVAGRLGRDSLLGKILTNNIQWFISVLLEPLHKKGIATNYRALEHVMCYFEWHFSEVAEFVKHEKLWQLLIPRYFSIMYYKEVGELFDTEFPSNFVDDLVTIGGDRSIAEYKFLACYPIWDDLQKLLPDECWEGFIGNTRIDNGTLAKYFGYILKPQESLMSKWYSVWELDDDKVKSLIDESDSALTNHEISSPEDIYFLAQQMLEMQEAGGLNESKEDIQSKFFDYIDHEANDGNFASLLRDIEFYGDQVQKLKKRKTHDSFVEEIRKKLLTTMDDAFTRGVKSMFNEMLDVLHDKELLEHWFNSDHHRDWDIYSGNDPQVLWEKLDTIPTAAFNAVLDIFQGYLIDFAAEFNNLSADGFLFWDSFVVIAKARRKTWTASSVNIMKNVSLGHFIEEVDPFLDKYAKSRNITRRGGDNGQDEV